LDRRVQELQPRDRVRLLWLEPHVRVALPQPVLLDEIRWHEAGVVQQRAARGDVGVVLAAQRVRRGAIQQRQRVGGEVECERRVALERRLLEQPLAEAVDRRHHDLVEVVERVAQQLAGAGALHELLQERIAGAVHGRRECRGQACAQPVLQLLGRRDGERHDQRLVEPLDAALEQQSQQQADDGVGLAGAGTRLQQHGAGVEGDGREVERSQLHGAAPVEP
jgi:hypothetical protein